MQKNSKIFGIQGLVRKSWKFRVNYNGKYYPQMMFGGEIKKILKNIDNWFDCFYWLKEEERIIIDEWKKIFDILHLTTEEIIKLIKNDKIPEIRIQIDSFIEHLISKFGREIIQFYFHYIDFHFLDIIKDGVSLCNISNQGLEHSHSLHKNIQRCMTSNDSSHHHTPSSHQILLRQLRIFITENNIIDSQQTINEEELDLLMNNFIGDEILDL